LILSQIYVINYGQIIANHTVVDRFDDIPAEYMTAVKKMWLVYAGESHAWGVRNGLRTLASTYPAYAVSTAESGSPDPYTETNLRANSITWGDL
jgi:hypothetical protein